MKIYLAGAISGQTSEQVMSYFEDTAKQLRVVGYEVLHPMVAKGFFRNNQKYQPHGYHFPPATDHAIFERDKWMVSQCDVVYCNLTAGSANVSIGCTMELAWGSLLGKHTVLAMQDGNIHKHAFILEAADIVWETHEDAISYLETLIIG
jgi:nucleoside 2-deoxyribosyltransferase